MTSIRKQHSAYEKRLRRILMRSKKFDLDQLDRLEKETNEKGIPLAALIIEKGILEEDQLLTMIAIEADIPIIRLPKLTPDASAMIKLTKEQARSYGVFPISKKGVLLTIAVSDPFNREKFDSIEILTKCTVCTVLATENSIQDFILSQYEDSYDAGTEDSSSGDEEKAVLEKMGSSDFDDIISGFDDKVDEENDDEVEEEAEGVIKLANKIIIDAYQKGVSDIHIEPYFGKDDTVIRFRSDGECFVYQTVPNSIKRALITRFKIMSNLDIAERRLPQDGKIQFKKYGRLPIELRVATLPTVGGNEDAVMRILASSKPIPMAQMGFSDRNFSELQRVIQYPYGLLLCVGPTGSGKTTTLHSCLGFINQPKRKIWTAEDPVEITQRGLRQVQVQAKIGYTFAAAMRAFLRADPDVIMVGEMRDEETASIGIEASLTGHLVLSTLHTNSAPETITRLIDMGIDPFNFADALLGILAQRLARRLCKECKTEVPLGREEYDEIITEYGGEKLFSMYGPEYSEELTIGRAIGCKECNGIGYRGRLGLHELLVGTDPIRAIIQRQGKVIELRNAAIGDGMSTLKQDGILKVLQGQSDLTAIRAVCIQ